MNRLEVIASQLSEMPNSADFLKRERSFAAGAPWTNWVGVGGHCRPKAHHRPSTVEEVCAIVKQAVHEGTTCKVAGAGHSPSTLAFTNGHMVHLGPRMNRILQIDSAKGLVTCEGGCTIKKLVAVLDGHDLMLPILPSVSWLTIAGFLAVAGHSSGIGKATLSAYIVAITLVNGAGEVVRINLETNENADLLPAVACNLGVLGIVSSVTLRVEPKAIFKVHSAPLTLGRLHQTLASKVTMIESYRFWWVPFTDKCYEVSARRIGPLDEVGGGSTRGGHSVAASTVVSVKPYQRDNAAAPATGNVQTGSAKPTAAPERIAQQARNLSNVIKLLKTATSDERTYIEWLQLQQRWDNRLRRALQFPKLGLAATEAALYAAAIVPALQPFVNRGYRCAYLNQTVDSYGTQSDAFDIPIVLPQNACEWAVPAAMCLEVLDALRELIRRNDLKRIHFIVEVRFTDEDNIWLSPAYRRKCCYIGLVQFMPFGREVVDTATYYRLFAELMTKKGGRPHWSKYMGTWGYAELARAYPKWTDFLEVRKRLDPSGVFLNDWFRRLLRPSQTTAAAPK